MMLNNLMWLLVLASIVIPAVLASPFDDPSSLIVSVTSILLATDPSLFGLDVAKPIDYERAKPVKRKRKDVADIFQELGHTYQRRSCRMNEDAFWNLHKTLKPHMKSGSRKRQKGSTKRNEINGAVNGIISTKVRLSAALRHFAGGDPLDVCLVFGICHTEVYNSAWVAVDAVHRCPQLDVKFPDAHSAQKRVAAAFKRKSRAGFGCCAGAIDGMLIWLEKPRESECKKAKCGPKKFYCGRKSKFGFNMQATCDAEGRFLDVDISHPASTSDYLVFVTSNLKKKLESPGFLAPGLCLFGDNAHPNRLYCAIPYKNVSGGSKDNYNFYHSQVRIKIECAFGMLVNRWAILRKPLCSTIALGKATALVLCLCKLHNFCISERIKQNGGDDFDYPESTAGDRLNVSGGGGVPLEPSPTGLNPRSPEQLLHGGEHFDDVSASVRRRADRQENANVERLPQDLMHEQAAAKALARPVPRKWRKQGSL